LVNLLKDSIKAHGLAAVAVESTDLVDCARMHLQAPISEYKGLLKLNENTMVPVPNHSGNTKRINGLVWLTDDTIGVNISDSWEIWSLLKGNISHPNLKDIQKLDELQAQQQCNSYKLVNVINKPRTIAEYISDKEAFAIEVNNSILLSGQKGNLRGSSYETLENALAVEIYDRDKVDFWPKSSIIVSPFGIGKQFSEICEYYDKISISPNSKMAVASSKSGNILYLIDISKADKRNSLYAVSSAEMVPVCLVRSSLTPDKCSVIFNDGLYLSGDGSADGATLSDGINALSLSQLEVKYNRPDIVLERLGAPAKMIEEAKRLRNRLARRSDFKNLEGASLIDMPVVRLTKENPSSLTEKVLKLQYSVTSNASPLKDLLIYNNGALVSKVPILGEDGLPALDVEGSIQINLTSGKNNIQLCAVSEEGIPSAFTEKQVTCTSAVNNPKCYIVSCGISDYKDAAYNLRYAAKDAGDVADAFKKAAESRGLEAKVLTLKNTDVDLMTPSKIREFLSPATSDDEVVLFFAGHGLLDKDLNYHYARYDTDFSATENIGIQFDELESLVDCIKPLKRTVLFDTCHSGEVEDESKADVVAMISGKSAPSKDASNVNQPKIATRGLRVAGVEPKISRNDFLDLEKLFPDSRRAKGANILTSSSGSEFSMESEEWKNGLFTYCLLKALQNPETDTNKDGNISFSEIQEYIKKTVAQLSGGKQRPISRGVNREVDVVLASLNPQK